MIQGVYNPEQKEYDWNWILPKEHEYQEMTGAGDCFGEIMFLRGLRAPLIQNLRARFYFTERGWDKVGRFVAGHARKKRISDASDTAEESFSVADCLSGRPADSSPAFKLLEGKGAIKSRSNDL